jgi:predicted hydrocarbon binding protein
MPQKSSAGYADAPPFSRFVSIAPDILVSLGLQAVISDVPFAQDANGRVADSAGGRVIFAAAEAIRGLQHVLERERPGAWRITMTACGRACGRRIAATLEAKLATLGQPALAALPLEAGLAFLEHAFAAHGWGRLKLDLAHAAEHGLVVARVEHSFFVETLPAGDRFVDAMLAGILQSFFEHISGQTLGSEEIACGRGGANHCTFVIAPIEKLAAVLPRIGQDSAESILAQLTRA